MCRNFAKLTPLCAILFAFALTFIAPPKASAQKKGKDQKTASDDPLNKPRKNKQEINNVYKKWVDEDVAYIITPAERKAWDKLQTDEEREQFIEEFWRRRNPDPDSDTNEYREQYYERIAYANQHFTSGIPGWKTDRGRIYITFGKPDEVESHPSGGSYDRPYYEGGGTTSTYPFEIWFYRYLPGVGSGIEIEFVDPTGSGEYRIARSPDEKDALLHVPGAGLTLSEELGLTSKADRVAGINGMGMNGAFGYQREQDNPFTKLQTQAALFKSPPIEGPKYETALAGTPVIEDSPLDFDMRIDFFRQSEDKVITAITIQTPNKDLSFKDMGGVETAHLNIYGRITSLIGKRVATFEDPVTTTASVEELNGAKERKSAYQKALPLSPGRYKVSVVVTDANSGAKQIKELGFEVPKYDSKQLATSTLILAARLQDMSNQPAVGQFVIGQYKVIPNVSGTYRRGEPIGLYMQIYNAQIDQTTLRPAVDVEYALLKGGKEVGKQAEDWRGNADAGNRLTLARFIDTRGLAAGDYQLQIRIKDRVSGQTLAPTAKFTITSDGKEGK
jgi:GWxTD domain-containing protein